MELWRQELYASAYSQEYLAHHGIKGQRWGVRRFQYEDGSLTPEGRARYEKKYKNASEAASDIEKIIREDFPERTSKLSSKLQSVTKEGDELSRGYAEYYDTADSDPSFIKAVQDRKNKYVEQGFDEEYAEEDAINEIISEKIPEALKERRKQFDNSVASGWKDIEEYTKEMVDAYSDVLSNAAVSNGRHGIFGKGYDKLGKDTIKNAVLNSAGDVQWYSYMSRHYDDYWVDDLENRSRLEDRIKKKLRSGGK